MAPDGSRTLYISDLDGTLLGADSLVSARSRAMLNEAIARGALFTVATARTPATVATLLKGIDVDMPLVVMTGATLWNPATGRYSRTRFLPEEEARRVLEIYRRRQFPAFIYTLRNNLIQIYHIGPLCEEERQFMAGRDATPFKIFHIPADGESEIPERLDNVLLFYSMQPTAAARAAYDEVRSSVECSPLCYHDIFGPEVAVVEIFAAGVTKASAIKTLAEAARAGRTVAFGDNINDLPMLRDASLAVAVENAVPEVKAAADITIGPNTADSVARFILEDTLSANIQVK